jgi:hypothetical protein
MAHIARTATTASPGPLPRPGQSAFGRFMTIGITITTTPSARDR